MNHPNRPRIRISADIALLMVVLFWGINMPIMKFAISRMDGFLYNALRLTLSAITLGIWLLWQRRRSNEINPKPRPRINGRTQWAGILLYVFLGGFAYQFLFLIGMRATSAGNAALILSAIPMWTAILAFILLRERLTLAATTGLVIALLGVVIVILGKPQNISSLEANSTTLIGNLLILTAAFSWALLSVVSRKVMEYISPLKLAFFCVAFSLPFHYLIAGAAWLDIGSVLIDPWLIAAIVYSGVFSTGLATAFWNYGVKQLGAAHASGFQNLVPLIAMGASWLLIAEIPFPLQMLGGSLIISGMIVMRRFRTALPENPVSRCQQQLPTK